MGRTTSACEVERPYRTVTVHTVTFPSIDTLTSTASPATAAAVRVTMNSPLPALSVRGVPTAVTVAREESLEDTVKARPERLPAVSETARNISRELAPAPARSVTLGAARGGTDCTVSTGTSEMVMVAEPVWPSLEALSTTTPESSAVNVVAAPLVGETDAFVLSRVQAIVRFVSAFPAASRGVALAFNVSPTCRFAVVGATSTRSTGTCATVKVKDAGPMPSTVTSMAVVPVPTAVTTPDVETVATRVLVLDHSTRRPANESRFPTHRVPQHSPECGGSPTVTDESGADTLTDATGMLVTVNGKLAGPTPSTVTPIVVLPAAIAVISPALVIVATPVALLDQVTCARRATGRCYRHPWPPPSPAPSPPVTLESVALM